jgi:4-hydroxy-tetrahydrodipicolinate reductase
VTQRIGLVGAGGRLGSAIAAGLASTDDLEVVAAVSPSHAGQRLGDLVPGIPADHPSADVVVGGTLDGLVEAGVDIAVEVTGPATVGPHLVALLEQGIHTVVGASGIDEASLETARILAAAGPARALVVPNFSIGAVLLERFAADAARYLPHVEIIELHHDRKLDAPSGTALATAAAVARAQGDAAPEAAGTHGERVAPGSRGSLHHGIPVHAIRLPGLVAHQEVLLGGTGQLLTLRHDTMDRSAFVDGAVLACRRVASLDGLVVGLGELL